MFLYPPRPERAIERSLISWYEKRGYVAQVKKNGTCSVSYTDPDGRVHFWKRKGEPHLAWEPTEEARDFLGRFPDTHFVFELLHSKGGGVRDTLYLFDVMTYLGKSLVGTTFADRMVLLGKVVPISSERIIFADVYVDCLTGLYDSLTEELDEGIVLKKLSATLEPCLREGDNDGWQVKCRVRHKNFSF